MKNMYMFIYVSNTSMFFADNYLLHKLWKTSLWQNTSL